MIVAILFSAVLAFASDEHGHEHEETHVEEAHIEESEAIGPNKGITEKGKDGFKISTEATKAFALKLSPIPAKTLEIPKHALVQFKETKSVFRLRNGWLKKVPAKVISKRPTGLTIEISEFESGDQIVTEGAAFLRTTEVMAEEGASHSH